MPGTYLTPHFTLEELVFSQAAARKGIDNTPPEAVVANLRRLCGQLEKLRKALGNRPLLVSSGYRCAKLNKAVGGAANSFHMKGLAVDFTMPALGNSLDVARAVAASGVDFDQLIHEYGTWVHFAVAEEGAQPREQQLSIFRGTGYLAGLSAGPADGHGLA